MMPLLIFAIIITKCIMLKLSQPIYPLVRGSPRQPYCAGKEISVQQAIAYGELFALPMGYPAMILGDRQIHGYLLSFPNVSILNSLDQLEDYQCDRATSENLYNRYEIEVFDLEGNSLGFAWAYFMTSLQMSEFGGVAQIDGCWSGK